MYIYVLVCIQRGALRDASTAIVGSGDILLWIYIYIVGSTDSESEYCGSGTSAAFES